MGINLPTFDVLKSRVESAAKALQERVFVNANNQCSLRICSVCDRFATIDNKIRPFSASLFRQYLHRSGAHVDQYTSCLGIKAIEDNLKKANHPFADFVVSPDTMIVQDEYGQDCVFLCDECKKDWRNNGASDDNKKLDGPIHALWKGFYTGELPECLKILNMAEVQLISPNRIVANGIVCHAHVHKGVYGWHSMFENRVDLNVGTIQYLVDAGMKGEFICVLCGPFWKSQEKELRKKYTIRPQLVIKAFEWLKENNVHFRDLVIPEPENIPKPKFLKHKSL